jgi:DNA-binding beta-propeller fold protein YncE
LLSGSDIAISPDGRNVYASTRYSVAIFDRDPPTGELTQPAGIAGCTTSSRKEYLSCSHGRGLGGVGMSISPDGLNVYVGSHPLTVLDRDPATGALTQEPVSEGAKPTAGDVIVSPDGKNVYVSTYEPYRLITFVRDPATGALTRVSGRAGCISEKGEGGCRRGREFSYVFGLSISQDGRNVYGAASRGLGQGDYGVVTILDRLPDGTLAQKKGRAGCFAMFGGEGEGCARTESLSEAEDITVSADGKRVYVFDYFSRVPAVLFRHPSGRLTEHPTD